MLDVWNFYEYLNKFVEKPPHQVYFTQIFQVIKEKGAQGVLWALTLNFFRLLELSYPFQTNNEFARKRFYSCAILNYSQNLIL